jgi:hypothetical protein
LFVFITSQSKTFVVICTMSLERRVVLESGDERDIILGFDFRCIQALDGNTLK